MVLRPHGFLSVDSRIKGARQLSTFDLWNANKSKVAIVGLTHRQFAKMLLFKNVEKKFLAFGHKNYKAGIMLELDSNILQTDFILDVIMPYV